MKVCIDPGHGMSNRAPGRYDSGAIGGGLEEADIALLWALTLKYRLTQAGIPCWMTRDDDRDDDPVGTRDNRAMAEGCTHFVSIHCNSGGGTGIETYYRDADDLPLARLVQQSLLGATGGKDRGIHPEGDSQHPRLAVLAFKGPAILCETGFIDNGAKDRKWLTSKAVRDTFAKALTAGFLTMRGSR